MPVIFSLPKEKIETEQKKAGLKYMRLIRAVKDKTARYIMLGIAILRYFSSVIGLSLLLKLYQ